MHATGGERPVLASPFPGDACAYCLKSCVLLFSILCSACQFSSHQGVTTNAEGHGYLGRDPEAKYSQQGTAIAQFSLATTERWRNRDGELPDHTEWFAVKTFGRRAEIAGEFLHTGSRVYLEGRKRTESWDDKQSGGKR